MSRFYFIIFFLITTASAFSQIHPNLNEQFKLAQSYERDGDLGKAKKIASELFELQPNNPVFYKFLNKIYIGLKEYDNSIALISEKIKSSPKDITLYGSLGTTYHIMGDTESAYAVWDSALDLTPNSAIGYRTISNYAVENRAYDKAIEILNKGKNKSKNSYLFSNDLAYIYSVKMDYTKAAHEYCDLLIAKPEQLKSVKSKIKRQLNKKEALIAAIEVVKKRIEENDDIILLEFISHLYYLAEMQEEAFKIVIRLDNQIEKNGSRVYSFAHDVLRQRQYSVASKAFEWLMNKYPNSIFAQRAKLGYLDTKNRMLENSYNLASSSWKPFSIIDSTFMDDFKILAGEYRDITLTLADINLRTEAMYKTALIYKDKIYNYHIADSLFGIVTNMGVKHLITSSYIRLGEISIAENELEKGSEYFKLAAEKAGGLIEFKNEAIYKNALAEFWRGNFRAAFNLLNSQVNLYSDDFGNDALQLGLMINNFKSDSLNLLKYAKADLLAEQKRFNEAAAQFKMLAEEKSLIAYFSRYKYAEMLIAIDELPLAAQILENILKEEEISILTDKSVFLLAQIYQYGINNIPKSKEYYALILDKYPNSLYFDKSRKILNDLKTN